MTSPEKHSARALCRHMACCLIAGLTIASAAAPDVCRAQEAKAVKDKASDVFDDDNEKKAADAKPADPTKPAPVSDRDSIGFTQQNVASQMTELEERMFRLSEALRSLEPENASRLRLALKFSREELILQQMKETQKLLKEAQLSKAETEVREMLAKLEHLRSLLLSEDLDFQMKLARLRQMRETLGQLERIIKEEKRELAWSRSAIETQAEILGIGDRQTSLASLVRDQKSVIKDTQGLKSKDDSPAGKKSREAARAREEAVKKAAAGLALEPMFAKAQPPFLKQADGPLGDAISLLATPDSAAAVAAEEAALALFQKELDRLTERKAKADQAVASSEFLRFEHEQARNRAAADALGVTSARLGDSGIALQKDLIRAGGSMQAAEKELDKSAAKPAAVDQLEALKHLQKSRDALAKAVESLLVELRSELQSRILAELTEMHEMQVAIRETTESQAPRIVQRSRTALLMVIGLAQKESALAEQTDHLRALTEETEFGIALPTSLRVIGREMTKVQGWLKEGDASARTIEMEKRIEQDLLGLLEAMRRLPPSTPPPPGAPLPTEPRARERELNRLIAELKMIRLLQSRLNDDTNTIDQGRPAAAVLPPALRREIETLRAGQEEIRDSLSKVSSRFEPGEDAGNPPPADKVDE